MTLVEIRDDVLRKVWVEYPSTAPAYLFTDARTAINQALQSIWLSTVSDDAKRKPLAVNLTAGQRRTALPATLQRITGLARINGNPIREASNQSDVENYSVRYVGDLEESTGTPQIYYLESQRIDDDASMRSWLWVAPTPTENMQFDAMAVYAAPRYSLVDLTTSGIPDVPHGYVESLLLPLARYYMTRCHWFSDEAKREALESDAAAALDAHGMSIPWRTKQRKEETAA